MTKSEFMKMLSERNIDEPSASLLDDSYTFYDLDFRDANVIKRFLGSIDIANRYEAIVALRDIRQIDDLEIDALLLFATAKAVRSPASYSAIDLLVDLARRGSSSALRVLTILAADHAFVSEYMPNFLVNAEGVKWGDERPSNTVQYREAMRAYLAK
jgi:hypothetical protein